VKIGIVNLQKLHLRATEKARWKEAELRVELVMLQLLVLHYMRLDRATLQMHGQVRWEQSFRAPWLIQEEKGTAHHCYVVERIRAQWPMHWHTIASQLRRQEELSSTDVETGAAEGWSGVHHGGQYRYEWRAQESHRVPHSRVLTKHYVVDSWRRWATVSDHRV
jgi:hypothetical protein